MALRSPRAWLNELVTGKIRDTTDIPKREGCSKRAVRLTLSVAFFNPQITKAAVKEPFLSDPVHRASPSFQFVGRSRARC